MTLDGGRYAKSQLGAIRQPIVQALRHAEIRIGFGDSTAVAGLQLVDVIVNTVFQSLRTGDDNGARESLRPVIEGGRMSLRHVKLEGLRPNWLREP